MLRTDIVRYDERKNALSKEWHFYNCTREDVLKRIESAYNSGKIKGANSINFIELANSECYEVAVYDKNNDLLYTYYLDDFDTKDYDFIP